MRAPVECIIPAFNAAHSLAAVMVAARTAMPEARIVIVDDGSTDDTARVAATADQLIRFDRNRGKGAALRAGFGAALTRNAMTVVTVDADGQHDPACAPRLLEALADADLVIGTRTRPGSRMPMRRRITNALASAAFARITGVALHDTQSGFRAIRRVVLERVYAAGDRYEFETDFLIRAALAGFRITAVETATVYGAPSHFRPFSDSARVVGAIWRHRRRAV